MTAPNVFDSVTEVLANTSASIDVATQAAVAAQQQLQEIQNTEAAANTSVFSWSTVFSGADGTTLNGTDFSSSTGIKIRGSHGNVGIDSSVGNGRYRADIAYPYLTSNQSASVVIGSIDSSSTAISYILFQCDINRTTGAYLYIYAGNLRIGKFTRSGSTYNFASPLASLGVSLKAGDIIRAYNTDGTYYVKVNNIQKISITDSGDTITRDSSHVYTSILMERNSFLYTGDGPRFASFAMSDDIAGGIPVSDSWLFTRSSTTTVSYAYGYMDPAQVLPANFLSAELYKTGVTTDELGRGRVKIANTDWYELSAGIIAGYAGQNGFVAMYDCKADWAVRVNGAQVTGPINGGNIIRVYLNKDDIVQPMILPYGLTAYGENAMRTYYLKGFSSWMGRRISA